MERTFVLRLQPDGNHYRMAGVIETWDAEGMLVTSTQIDEKLETIDPSDSKWSDLNWTAYLLRLASTRARALANREVGWGHKASSE
jgi:hypothetical protein